MDSLVIYATRNGNTRACAEAIADALRPHGPVTVRSAEEALAHGLERTDFLVIGGPTEGHGMTEGIKELLDRSVDRGLDGVAAAAFDTRLSWPMFLSGSAAKGIAERLREVGANLVSPPTSFIVSRTPELEPGELERAAAWGREIGDAAAAIVAYRRKAVTV